MFEDDRPRFTKARFEADRRTGVYRYEIQSVSTLILDFPRPVSGALILVLLSLLGACASGVGQAPAGGPADSTAPAVVSTTPATGSINFRGQEIEVLFSEYIQESTLPTAPAHGRWAIP